MTEYPEWKKAACGWCAKGVPMSAKMHHTSGAPFCTAPTEAQHIEQLTARVAELEYDLNLSRRLDDIACKKVTDLQAANAVLRTALEEIQASPMTEWIYKKATDALSSEAVAAEPQVPDCITTMNRRRCVLPEGHGPPCIFNEAFRDVFNKSQADPIRKSLEESL